MSEPPSNTEASVYRGFAVAAIFGWLTTLLWIAPWYIDFSGALEWFCYTLGGLSIAVSFIGAFNELSRLLQSEALSWFGVGMAFFAIVATLHVLATYVLPSTVLAAIAKAVVLVLALIGGGMTFFGVAAIFEEAQQQYSPQKISGRGSTILTILSFVSAILPILGYAVNATFGVLSR